MRSWPYSTMDKLVGHRINLAPADRCGPRPLQPATLQSVRQAQRMRSDHISGIDHLVIGVNDLDRAKAAYRRLGFKLSPRAVHSAAMGTANHTIMLERDYFEL